MITDFLERCINAGSVDELRDAYCETMAHFGFAHVLYAARFMLALPPSVLDEGVQICSNFPPDFTDPLLARQLLIDSHWGRWAIRNSGSISARGLADLSAGDAAAEARARAAEHGFEAGQLISLKDKVLRAHGAVLLNPYPGASHAEAERLWHAAEREITLISWLMHMRMATIRRSHPSGRLTPRQREVLEWSSAGKTVAEIGTILGVTAATIEKHLRLARDTMAAGTTAQAILKAHLTHQLFVQDSAESPPR